MLSLQVNQNWVSTHITMAHVPIQYLEPVRVCLCIESLMKNHLIQMELLQKQSNSDEVTHDSQNTETEIPRTDKFPSSIQWPKCGHWHCARQQDPTIHELLDC